MRAVIVQHAIGLEIVDPISADLWRIDRNVAEAVAWLAARLAGGAQPTAMVEAAAKEAGFSKRTLERARATLNVTASQEGRTWVLRLPPGSPHSAKEGVQAATSPRTHGLAAV